MKKSLLSLALISALAGCTMIPDYLRPEAPVQAAYPTGDVYPQSNTAGGVPAAELGWREFFQDADLQQLIDSALRNNRDLRVAALNVEAYRAQYRIQRAELYPQVDIGSGATRQRLPGDLSQSGEASISSQYSATVGITAWELDLFGRLRSLNEQALEQYFATAEAQRSTQISLVASVANAWFTLQADQTLLELANDTLGAYQRTYELSQRTFDVGASSALDLRQARTSVDSARVSVAQYRRQVAQDRNSLTLLLGGPLPENLRPNDDLYATQLAEVPAGLPSELLQRRPDILAAEHNLKAANAVIGAARAAFFPSISLTANAGTASSQLSGLFDGGSGTWLFEPQIYLPIFTAGSLSASLDAVEIAKNIQVADYEKTIQTAFQEVSDGLVARQTYREQLDAQRQLVASTEDYYNLADRRYRGGVDSFLTLLDAQRQLFSVQQGMIGDRLAQLTSEVNLYKALGGGWQERTAPLAPLAQAD
jgi:multidrug efflux system outer membrane protein